MAKQLNVLAPIGHTGYGQAGYYFTKELDRLGWEIALFNKGGGNDTRTDNRINQLIARSASGFPHNGACLQIWHQNNLAYSVGKGPYFAFPFFELDTFTDTEKWHLKYPDELVVASNWAAQIVQEQVGRTPKVIPLGYDPDIFYPYANPNQGTFRFINIGKWEVRKGHDVLVEMFNKAFTPKDDVELWMMPNNPFIKPAQVAEWFNWYMESPMGLAGKIRILPPSKTQHGVASTISACDCGLFPARAEGWNLELLECLASNKPVITTRATAHTDFCTDENAYLVDITEQESAYDGVWFFGQGNWPAIGAAQQDQFIEHMRYVVRNQIRQNPAGSNNASEFTWAKCAVKLEKILLDKT